MSKHAQLLVGSVLPAFGIRGLDVAIFTATILQLTSDLSNEANAATVDRDAVNELIDQIREVAKTSIDVSMSSVAYGVTTSKNVVRNHMGMSYVLTQDEKSAYFFTAKINLKCISITSKTVLSRV